MRRVGAYSECSSLGILLQPIGDSDDPTGQQPDIEAQLAGELVHPFFFSGEKVEQQRRQAAQLQVSRDKAITGAEPAAAAAVNEEHQPRSSRHECEHAFEHH